MYILKKLLATVEHFKHRNCSQFAASLSYSTLLSVVPITVLLFYLSLQTDTFSSMFIQVREQFLTQFLPTSRALIESYLLQTTQNIESFSYLGIALVSLSAIWLSLGIEKALNHVWAVKTPRKLILRIPAHIIIWLISPVLIMLSISATTWLISQPYLNDFTKHASTFSYLIPWFISSFALFLIYFFIPNTKVSFQAAWRASLFAGLLFELSKWGFTLYITEVAMYEKLYGALAALPIFMLWVYISWLIVLWGASFCVSLQSEQRHS